MSITLYRGLLPLLLAVFACTLLAGNEPIHFKLLSVEDGLAHSTEGQLLSSPGTGFWYLEAFGYSNTIDIDTAKMISNVLDEEFIGKAIRAVEDNIDNEKFSADDLAELLCVSRSTLYIKMNSVSGEPPANFIRRIRFNKACKLLLEERYSIAEISGMTGFGSPSYFSSSFKKYIGCLPSEYARSQKGGV